MKRYAIWLLAGCVGLGALSAWAAAPRERQPEAPNLHPSKIYGYISLKDPSTQQLHLTANPSNVIPTGLSVVFRSVDGVEQSVALRLGEIITTTLGTDQYRHHESERFFRFVRMDGSAQDRGDGASDDVMAILYEIAFEQRREFGAPVTLQEHQTDARAAYPPYILTKLFINNMLFINS